MHSKTEVKPASLVCQTGKAENERQNWRGKDNQTAREKSAFSPKITLSVLKEWLYASLMSVHSHKMTTAEEM